jgi:hypothetical protein
MKKILTGGLAALTLGGAVLGGATTASARDWDHHNNGGAALAAGIAGLAIGAALASSSDHGYYDGYYAPAPAYYGPSYYGSGYYGSAPAYYQGANYYSYYRGCRVEWRWNHRWNHYERVRACY